MAVTMKRSETRWLPDALSIKERVDRGEVLGTWATSYLDEVLQDILQAKPLVDQYPEFQPLYARTARMYREITSRALENEQASSGAAGAAPVEIRSPDPAQLPGRARPRRRTTPGPTPMHRLNTLAKAASDR